MSTAYHDVLKRIQPQAEPAFEDPAMQQRVWGRVWGCPKDVGRLRMVLVHAPGAELDCLRSCRWDPEAGALVEPDERWYWRDSRPPDPERVAEQHAGLVAALEREDVEVVRLAGCTPYDPDAVFTRDMGMAVRGGAIVGRMATVGRRGGRRGGVRGEEAYLTRTLAALGMPILRTLSGTGLMEGGSFAWLADGVAAIALAFRGSAEVARQIEEVLVTQGARAVRVPLVGHSLHLDGAFAMVDYGNCMVDITRLPYWFLQLLDEMEIAAVEVDPGDPPLALNGLALAPGRFLMSTEAPRTAERLARAGVEVVTIPYGEIHKGGGGIHCSTLPLVREA